MPRKIGNGKLTAADVIGLRARLASGETTTKQEARRFNMSVESVRRADRGDTYFDIPRLQDPQWAREVAARPPATYEPLPGEIEASLDKLRRLQAAAEQAPDANRLLDEMMGRRGGVPPPSPLDAGVPPEGQSNSGPALSGDAGETPEGGST